MTVSRRRALQGSLALAGLLGFKVAWADRSPELASRIAADAELRQALYLARTLMANGLNAGNGYPEVWIRDTNTFMDLSLEVNDPKLLRSALLNFLLLQGPEGDIVDGYVSSGHAQEPPYRTSAKLPGYQAHKNTVVTDQESSLVLAFAKYMRKTGDFGILEEVINGMAVRGRLASALQYPLTERFSVEYGLVWGGATIDWGDVAPDQIPGTHLSLKTHRAIGIYNNAMLVSSIREYVAFPGIKGAEGSRWAATLATLKAKIQEHLWDTARRKYVPHLYLEGSPFPRSFVEAPMYLHGGTAVAIEADLLNPMEVAHALRQMRANVKAANASSIGLTIYPPYPKGYYAEPILTRPYTYQNAGDWCWFGGRMVQQLIRLGMVDDAYLELKPMISRVVRTGKFHEWWTPDDQPRGSSDFRGSAGVLGIAIEMLYGWARAQGVQIT